MPDASISRNISSYSASEPSHQRTSSGSQSAAISSTHVRSFALDAVRAALRLVAIDAGRQREGHGSVLLRLAEDFIRRHGRRHVVVHGNPDTIGFYLGNGYVERPWEDDVGIGEHIDVAKDL